VELKFSSFYPADFTDHHSAYYLALEKNKGAWEKEDEPFTTFLNKMTFSIGCCHETRICQIINPFAISLGFLAFILGEIYSLFYSLIKINSQLLNSFLSNLNASFT